jgi:hypothetical protein
MLMLVLYNIRKAHDRKDIAAFVSADHWKFTKLPEFHVITCLSDCHYFGI